MSQLQDQQHGLKPETDKDHLFTYCMTLDKSWNSSSQCSLFFTRHILAYTSSLHILNHILILTLKPSPADLAPWIFLKCSPSLSIHISIQTHPPHSHNITTRFHCLKSKFCFIISKFLAINFGVCSCVLIFWIITSKSPKPQPLYRT